jgi:hypothetical protein
MEYIKDQIRRLINWANSDNYAMDTDLRGYKNYANSASNAKSSPIGSYGTSSIDGHTGGMNFTVYSATGGKVVQIRTYDPRSDIARSTLYVITDKEDLGQELGHIITVESLSK